MQQKRRPDLTLPYQSGELCRKQLIYQSTRIGRSFLKYLRCLRHKSPSVINPASSIISICLACNHTATFELLMTPAGLQFLLWALIGSQEYKVKYALCASLRFLIQTRNFNVHWIVSRQTIREIVLTYERMIEFASQRWKVLQTKIKREVALILQEVVMGVQEGRIRGLVDAGVILVLVDSLQILAHISDEMVIRSLRSIQRILKSGIVPHVEHYCSSLYAKMVRQLNGVERILKFYHHNNLDVVAAAFDIISNFFTPSDQQETHIEYLENPESDKISTIEIEIYKQYPSDFNIVGFDLNDQQDFLTSQDLSDDKTPQLYEYLSIDQSQLLTMQQEIQREIQQAVNGEQIQVSLVDQMESQDVCFDQNLD
eukprot:TRINITY_DN4752_c0_g1_i14.p1 TRINITY_DN4752_c0_g1~~TRINITY_DN4752_c0_g1_i14.p1  ORF type:complete len:370 (+),score=21.64 TRINITY_DN4752_c0_g1_i14:524-1633(+)